MKNYFRILVCFFVLLMVGCFALVIETSSFTIDDDYYNNSSSTKYDYKASGKFVIYNDNDTKNIKIVNDDLLEDSIYVVARYNGDIIKSGVKSVIEDDITYLYFYPLYEDVFDIGYYLYNSFVDGIKCKKIFTKDELFKLDIEVYVSSDMEDILLNSYKYD